jgi:hypothetical protein
MALLSGMIRTAAITGSSDSVFARIAGRQGGRWAERTVRAAMPTTPSRARTASAAASTRPRGDPAETLRELTKLRERDIITNSEFERLRARLHV